MHTHTIEEIDEGIEARIGHSQKMKREKNKIDVPIAVNGKN